MTDTPEKPEKSGMQSSGKFYPLTPELAKELRAIEHMPAGAWRLWSFLVTFEPFGNDYLELPELTDILAECNISKATFYRAIALFAEHELFDLQPTKMYVLNLRGQKIVSKMRQVSQNCDAESQKREFRSQKREFQSQNCDNPTEAKSQDVDIAGANKTSQCTNNRSIDLKEQQNSKLPPTHPVDPDIDKAGIGTGEIAPLTTEIQELCTQIQAAGIRPNKTIQATLYTLLMAESSPRTVRLVENAISALQEQQSKGTVKNPGGFLNAALRRNFTANQAKREARQRQEPRPEPPALNQISIAVDIALQQRREYALEILDDLWRKGWHDQLEELLLLRRDWGFSLTDGGVRDGTT